jgi:phospholipid/cholesterol/gamma-HCH transport system substrate-binding protein
MNRRRPICLLTAALAALALSGCSFSQGLYGASLPGAVGANGYEISAVFSDVSNLVPEASVRVADVTVGTVSKITLTRSLQARVDMHIEPSVKLPANSVAILQQTSLLGEKFVELGPPPGTAPAAGDLAPGTVIPESQTTAYPDLEQIFGALSLLLNGGGLQRLQTIDYELSQALSGREASVRDLLHQLTYLLGGLNQQKSQIVRALDATDQLTAQLEAQRQTIATALDDLGPGLKVLADERSQFVTMLSALSNLGQVATHVIDSSEQATITDLADLKPVVQRIAAAGADLPRSLDLLLDYPFPADAVDAMPGDFTALYVTLEFKGSNCLPLQSATICLPGSLPAAGSKPGTAVKPGSATGPGLPTLPSPLPGLPVPSPGPVGGLAGLLGGGSITP